MSKDILLMNSYERQKKAMVEAVKNKHFTVSQAAERLSISPRQMRRILRRYEQQGDQGLIHQHRGKPSNHRYQSEQKVHILDLYRTHYLGFGPTLAAEKMREEHHYSLGAETLRLWLKAAGLWDEKRKRTSYRKQRQRREQFGDLLQLDGSFHHWFGEEHPKACLMNMVDDATGTTLALLDRQETTEAAMRLLAMWLKRYGIPKSIYVDLKTTYVSPKHWVDPDEYEGTLNDAFSHFSNACSKLGIKIIKAYSPQAKGRVERKHALFQDRFVKELRLKKITTLSQANALLEQHFLTQLNEKFAKLPANPQDGHRDYQLAGDLEQIFCWEYTRQIHNDWTIRFKNKCYQLHKSASIKLRAKQSILVREHLDGSLSLWYQQHRILYDEIEQPSVKSYQKKGYDSAVMGQNARHNRTTSPWRQFNPQWLTSSHKNL